MSRLLSNPEDLAGASNSVEWHLSLDMHSNKIEDSRDGNCFIIDESGESNRKEQKEEKKKKQSFQEKLIGVKSSQIELLLTRYKKFLEKEEGFQLRLVNDESNTVKHEHKLVQIEKKRNEIQIAKEKNPYKDYSFEENSLTKLERYLNKNGHVCFYLHKKNEFPPRNVKETRMVPQTVLEARKIIRHHDIVRKVAKEREKYGRRAQSVDETHRLSKTPSAWETKSVVSAKSMPARVSYSRASKKLKPHSDYDNVGTSDDKNNESYISIANTPGPNNIEPSSKPSEKHLKFQLQLPSIETAQPVKLAPPPPPSRKLLNITELTRSQHIEDLVDQEEGLTVEEIRAIMDHVMNMSSSTIEVQETVVKKKPGFSRPETYEPDAKQPEMFVRQQPERKKKLPDPKRRPVSQEEVKREMIDVQHKLDKYYHKLAVEKRQKDLEARNIFDFDEAEDVDAEERMDEKKRKMIEDMWQVSVENAKEQNKPKDPKLLQLLIRDSEGNLPIKKTRGIPSHSEARSQRHNPTYKLRKMFSEMKSKQSKFEQQEYAKLQASTA